MRLEQDTKFELEVSEITKPIRSFDIHMISTTTEKIYESGCIKSNIGAFEVHNVFQPERCIIVEGRRVDIARMKQLFDEDEVRLSMKMVAFKIESSTLINGVLIPDVFGRQNHN